MFLTFANNKDSGNFNNHLHNSTSHSQLGFTNDVPRGSILVPGISSSEMTVEDDLLEEQITDTNFGRLINQLCDVLGKEKGLSSEDIDICRIEEIMESYASNESEWDKYALHDITQNYSRNGIVNINGNANLLILVWSPQKASAIHDHANAHCCMKILKGKLVESLYSMPNHEGEKLVLKQRATLNRDEVGYISDKIGLHSISNPHESECAVSLHLYTPPYASIYGCSMYEAKNGKKHHVDMSKYYSWRGQLINPKESSTC